MPQKTKKEKIRAVQKKSAPQSSSQRTAEEIRDQFFFQDIRKSSIIVAVILVLQVALYFAAQQGLIPFIPAI